MALKCMHYMETNALHFRSPNEHIIIIMILRSKLLVLDNACINQTMMNSYVFTYHGSEVRAIHRSMSEIVSLPEALSSCGLRCVGLPWDTDPNPKMEANRVDRDRPRTQVVDHFYKSPN